MKKILQVVAFLCLSLPCLAQLTTVTASHLSVSGRLVSKGQICFTPTGGAAGGFQLGIPGQSTNEGACRDVVAGVIANTLSGQNLGPLQVADTSLTSPANICYSVTISDFNGTVLGSTAGGGGYGCVQPSGSTFNFDDYVPSLPALPLGQSVADLSVQNLTVQNCTGPGCAAPEPTTIGVGTPTNPCSPQGSLYVDSNTNFLYYCPAASGTWTQNGSSASAVAFGSVTNGTAVSKSFGIGAGSTLAPASSGVVTSNNLDSTTNNGGSIQVALTASPAGTHIYVPAGTFAISTALEPKVGQVIDCAGGDVTAGSGTVLQPSSGAAIYAFGLASPTDNIHSVTVNNCTIDLTQDPAALGGVHQAGMSWWTWNNLKIVVPPTGSMTGVLIDGQSPGAYYNVFNGLKVYENPLTNWAVGNTHTCVSIIGSSFGGGNSNRFFGGSCQGVDTGISIVKGNDNVFDGFAVDGWGTNCAIIASDSYNSQNRISGERCETYTASISGKTSPTAFTLGANSFLNYLDQPESFLPSGVTPLADNSGGRNILMGVLNSDSSAIIYALGAQNSLARLAVNKTNPTVALDVAGAFNLSSNIAALGLNPIFGANATDAGLNFDIKAGTTVDEPETIRFFNHFGTPRHYVQSTASGISLFSVPDTMAKFSGQDGGPTVVDTPATFSLSLRGHPVYWADASSTTARGELAPDGSMYFFPAAGNSLHITTASPTGANVAQFPDTAGATMHVAYLESTTLTKAAVVPNTLPSAGQILAGNAGGTAYAPVSMSGDCSLSSAGAIACTKSGGVAFAASAFTDTTSASNVGSGTLNTARLPAIINIATGFQIGGAAAGGHYLRGNGTNYVDSAIQVADVPTLNQSTSGNAATATALAGTPTLCSSGQSPTGILPSGNATGCQTVGGGSSTWDVLLNPAGNLSLSMGSHTSFFNTTTAVAQFFAWKNTTAATVLASQSSPNLALCGTEWHASASAEGCFNIQFIPGTGADAANTIAFTHTGSATGATTTQFPGAIQAGSSGGVGATLTLPEGTAASASSGNDVCYADSTAHGIKCSYNNGSFNALSPSNATAVSHQWINSYTASSGAFGQSQPACGDLSNSGTACQAVAPATISTVSHNFLTSFTSSTGAYTQAQPAIGDLTATFSLPLTLTTNTLACPTCGLTGAGLNQFASTTSAQLAGVLSDETGTAGKAVFNTSPTFATSILVSGLSAGTATIVPQSAAGTPTLTLPTNSGTFAVSASAPLTINAATGNTTCGNCVAASLPGVGIAHFPGSSQTVTSSLVVAADITTSTITGTQLAASLALVTPNIGAATGTSLLVTGNVDGTAPVTLTTGTTATLGGTFKSGYTYNQEATAAAAVAYTLPTAALGLQYCIGNSWNGSAATTGVLTLNTSASGQFIIYTDGTLSATGGNVTSGGAAADAACVVGLDATHWQLYVQRGIWTKH